MCPGVSFVIASVTEAGSFSDSPLPVPFGAQKMSPAAGTSGVTGAAVSIVVTVAGFSLEAVTVVVTVVVSSVLPVVTSVVTTGSVFSLNPLPMAMTVGL